MPAGRARDVVVIGAGHNALVAACYLARTGLDVEVVERDSVVGGAVSTVERFPGYLMDRGSSVHIMIRHTGIVEELRLDECGLIYADLDPWGFAPFPTPDGGQAAITFWVDLDRTCASIAAVCGQRDADAYRSWATTWADRNSAVFAAFQEPPSSRRLLRRMMGTRRRGVSQLEIARQYLQPGDQLLDEHFEDERLKTALAWLGAQAGAPTHEVATADLVGWNPLMHRVPPGRPIGGSGRLTEALAERLRRTGGALRLDDGVRRILRTGTGVNGVVTDTGDRISAKAVLSGCHIGTTLALLDADNGTDAMLAQARRRLRLGNGTGMVVRVGTTALPQYLAAASDGSSYRAMQLLASSRQQLRTAYADYLAGRPPAEPAVLGMTLSSVDASTAPAGRHNVTLWAQWYPYELSTGEQWDDIGKREADRIVERVELLAPGFASSIEVMHIQTPLDLERELGLVRGNVMHLEMGLDAMFSFRPLPELAGYRTPLDGLYLCGASTHPGGGVFGASGRSAARVLLADRSRPTIRRRKRATPRG